MSYGSIGDGMRQFQLSRHNTGLKTTLNSLTMEMTSGVKNDTVLATGGDTQRFSSIDNRLKVLTSLLSVATETQFTLSTTQAVLANFDTQRNAIAEPLILITEDSSTFQIEQASRSARDRMDGLVSTLNTQVGNESLFAGTAVDQPALSSASNMMADIVTEIGGATDFTTIAATIDAWFDDPAGGFMSLGYTGDAGASAERRLDNDTKVTMDARADDPGIRAVLKGVAMAAISEELTGLDEGTRTKLLFEGGAQLQSAATDVASLQGRVGYAEGETERISVSLTAEQSSLGIARNLITQADPFETATKLQAVQLQLETHYAMTARLSQLNLSEYLR